MLSIKSMTTMPGTTDTTNSRYKIKEALTATAKAVTAKTANKLFASACYDWDPFSQPPHPDFGWRAELIRIIGKNVLHYLISLRKRKCFH